MTTQVAEHYGVGPFRAGARHEGTGASDDPVGAAAGSPLVLVAVVELLRSPSASQSIASHTTDPGANGGWRLRLTASGFEYEWSGGSAVASPELGPGPYVVAVFHDFDADRADVRAAGVEGGGTGAGADAPTQALAVGADPGGGSELVDAAVVALLSSNDDVGAAALASIESEVSGDLANGRDLDATLSAFTPEVYYDAADLAEDPSSWSDRKGSGVDLTRTGAPELRSVSARVVA